MTRLHSAAALLLAASVTISMAAQEQAPAAPQAPAADAPAPAVQAPRPTPPAPAAAPVPPAVAPVPNPAPQAGATPEPSEPDNDARVGNRNSAVRLGQDYTLAAGDRAKAAVVIFGNATIAGEVDRDAVVIAGTVRLARTARVGHDFVVIGGTATVEEGATVGENLVVVGGDLHAPATFSPGGEQVIIGPMVTGGTALSTFVPWLTRGLMWGRPIVPDLPWIWGIVAFFFVIYLAIVVLFDRTTFSTSQVVREKPLTAFGAGLLVLVLVGPVCTILAISIIGIAVIPFLLCALIGAAFLGKASVTRAIGGSMVFDEAGSRMLGARAFVIGSVFLCFAYVIPVLGFVTWAISSVMGLGAAAMTFLELYRREVPPAPEVVPPPIPGEAGVVPPPPTGGAVPGTAAFATAAADVTGGAMAPPSVPPAAVAVTFPYARFRDRLAALVLDLILVMLAVQLLDPRQEGRAFFLGMLVYHVGLWTWKQTTVGGIICQLRVVRTNASRLSFADALVRGLSSIFSVAVAGLGMLWILRDPERQAWHDKIAGTYVVKVPRNYPL